MFVYNMRVDEATMRCPGCDGCGVAFCGPMNYDAEGYSDCHKCEPGAHAISINDLHKCEQCRGDGRVIYDSDYENCSGCGNYRKDCECASLSIQSS